jgi:lysophospholipase L1-like esterase
MKEANKKIAKFMKKQKNSKFIDITNAMNDSNGNIRKELFVEDMLHMTPEGYKLWTSVMNPYMK